MNVAPAMETCKRAGVMMVGMSSSWQGVTYMYWGFRKASILFSGDMGTIVLVRSGRIGE